MLADLQIVGELGGVYGGVGLVRLLALSGVGTPRLVQHSLGKRPPDGARNLLLHQGAEGQGCGKNVCLCSRVADKPARKQAHGL